nr:MAG TPA: hypothetical protein [Caudoviricetes sp.]
MKYIEALFLLFLCLRGNLWKIILNCCLIIFNKINSQNR